MSIAPENAHNDRSTHPSRRSVTDIAFGVCPAEPAVSATCKARWTMQGHDVVVIGASAGGVETLKELVGLLPADLPASVLVVLHVPAHHISVLPAILNRSGALRAVHPFDGQPLEPALIYVAPPDRHLLVRPGFVSVTR